MPLLLWEHRLHFGPLPAYDEKYALTVVVLFQFAGGFPGKMGPLDYLSLEFLLGMPIIVKHT